MKRQFFTVVSPLGALVPLAVNARVNCRKWHSLSLALLLYASAPASAQPFKSIYGFGDSWTDTHNCTWDTNSFWHDRASNGPLWVELLSTNLGLPYLETNNFAVCGASLQDELTQIDAQFRVPPQPALCLYSLWLGADLTGVTNENSFSQVVDSLVAMNLLNVRHLYAKGARSIMLENQQDMSRFPALLTSESASALALLNDYTARWNEACLEQIQAYSAATPDLRIYWVDVFSKLDHVIDHPAQYGFTKTAIDALDDDSLSDKSFNGPGADYVWWNPYHLTSKAHQLLAAWHLEALTNSVLEQLEISVVPDLPSIRMKHLLIGRDYALQQSADLTNWTEVWSFTAASGTNQWSGTIGSGPAAYFRLQWRQ